MSKNWNIAIRGSLVGFSILAIGLHAAGFSYLAIGLSMGTVTSLTIISVLREP